MKFPLRLVSYLSVLACAASFSPKGFGQTFENCEPGEPISRLDGWTASSSSTAAIAGNEGFESKQSLELISGEGWVSRNFVSSPDKVTYVDFRIRPFAQDSDSPVATVDVDGAMLAFVHAAKNEGAILAAVSDTASEAGAEPEFDFKTNNKGISKEWIRLTVRLDRNRGIWDLFVNSRMVLADLPLTTAEAKTPKITFYGATEATFVDNVEVSDRNMLFKDSDKDGFSDIYEVAHGMNPNRDDRLADKDLDGVSNLVEIVRGTRPDIFGKDRSEASIIYVNNMMGNDENSGRSADARSGGNGPKKSIERAMKEAPRESLIVIMGGSGEYQEALGRVFGKDLKILPLENITIETK